MSLFNANEVLRRLGLTDKVMISAGKIDGITFINKFGHSDNVGTATDPQDVWSGAPETFAADGGTYTFSTTAAIDTISSSNAGDDQLFTIIGLDGDWNEVTQTATLNGQAKVVLGTSLIRVYRAYNSGTTDLAGNFYIYEDTPIVAGVPTLKTKIRAKVVNGTNQTEMAIYTIPKGKTGFFLKGYVGLSKNTTTEGEFVHKARPFGGVFLTKGRIGLSSIGASYWIYEYAIPPSMPEKTDIKITCVKVGANNTGAVGAFDLLLIDNTLLAKIETVQY